MAIRVKRIVDNIFYCSDLGHLIKLNNYYFPYCYQTKMPVNEPIDPRSVELDNPTVDFRSLPTEKPLSSQKEKNLKDSGLSKDQIGKPVAIVDDNQLVLNAQTAGS